MRCVILDDHQGPALRYADWSVLPDVHVVVSREHLAAEAVARARALTELLAASDMVTLHLVLSDAAWRAEPVRVLA